MKKESQEPAAEEPQKQISGSIQVDAESSTGNSSIVKRASGSTGVSYSVKDGEGYNKRIVPKKYYRVVFSERESDNESRDIFMCCNGNELIVQRGVEVIIPDSYYDIAKNAVVNSYKMNKATNRLEPVVYRRFNFNVLGEATEQEYQDLVKKCRESSASKEDVK